MKNIKDVGSSKSQQQTVDNDKDAVKVHKAVDAVSIINKGDDK